ncbi:glycosyltransferase family 2 protein [Microbacterium sp. M3]|uniref:Glycosyltransferase family 2 protein n=1 Tax=Microbacterium arthrosphaerae TaxID=792652 RepID=A0ABU4H3R2_9MICO|nr:MULTISPECIES: glycosyltransferase family 2 protein [Microbacterium]MDW4573367.1 glycosyltransferase family 2 protein [Microbacterium arthrosphaerae]MDW7607222.1 glycosyltransferase family 2 protein [Microbacterium sp. M3]
MSIIVPVYNAEPYLSACISSILEQDYRHLEIVLVDDGSTDGSGRICDEFREADDRVVVIHRENGGIAAAQNSGLDAATGELVTFCDNDDLMSARMIGRLVEILLASDADMSCCRWFNVGASSASELRDSMAGEPPGRFIVFDDPAKHYQGVFSVLLRRLTRSDLYYFSEANWGKLYRRSLFDGIRFPARRYAQDVAVAMDLYQRMGRVASCEDRLYYWLQRPDSVSHNLRTTDYYHDIVQAHGRCFELALADGILPARAYFGLHAIERERRSVVTPADQATYEDDRRYVAALRSRLTLWQRVRCTALHWVRALEVKVYDRTIHRRR